MKQFKYIIDLAKKEEYVYLLKNGNEYYIGQTTKLGNRLSTHQSNGFKFTHYSAVKVYSGVWNEREFIISLCGQLSNWPNKYLDSYCRPRYEYDSESNCFYIESIMGEPQYDTWRDMMNLYDSVDFYALDKELYTIHWNKQKNSAFSRFKYEKDPLDHEYMETKICIDNPFSIFTGWTEYKKRVQYIAKTEQFNFGGIRIYETI